jgi:hypothetical protein
VAGWFDRLANHRRVGQSLQKGAVCVGLYPLAPPLLHGLGKEYIVYTTKRDDAIDLQQHVYNNLASCTCCSKSLTFIIALLPIACPTEPGKKIHMITMHQAAIMCMHTAHWHYARTMHYIAAGATTQIYPAAAASHNMEKDSVL